MVESRIGVYPGTFDPVTNGHLDIIERATRVVDRVVVGVAVNAGKGPLFSLDERVNMMESEAADLMKTTSCVVEVKTFDGLLVNFAEDCGAELLIRGLRAVSDFEYEFQMTGMNARLAPTIETVFLMAAEGSQFISSKLIKEISYLGGDVSEFVTPRVRTRLQEKFAASRAAE